MQDIPMVDLDPDNMQGSFNKGLEKAFVEVQGSTAYRNDRERPYNGQPWTSDGERGRTLVEGLTMRDVADCIVQGFLTASTSEELQQKTVEISKDKDIGIGTKYAAKNTWRHDDIYQVVLEDMDPGAVIKSAMCFIEYYMGIFPNLPKLNHEPG